MPNQINKPGSRQNPIASTIMPGRRSLGEGWRKINIYPDPDTGTYIIDNQPTEAPADRKPIFVPGMGNISAEMADFFLEWQRDKANERLKKAPTETEQRDYEAELNQAWIDYMEMKARAFKGQTTVGSKLYQRESFNGR